MPTSTQENQNAPASGTAKAVVCSGGLGSVVVVGHMEGTDCASGARTKYDFATDNEALAKAHVEKYKGSWDSSGFYFSLPFRRE